MALIKISEQQTHLLLEFHAPESANALSLAAARELRAIAVKYHKWSQPVIVISGHPKVFCSGGNLTDYKKLKSKAEGLKVNREIENCLAVFAKWPAVKLAVIEGDVLGGGLEWLACFDYRWSTSTVVFAFWQRRIGLTTGWGGGARWAAKIGEDNLRKLLIEAEVLPADAALRHGLIDRILPAWKLREAVAQWSNLLQSEIAAELNQWSAKRAQKVFSKLWLGVVHSKVLKRWRS